MKRLALSFLAVAGCGGPPSAKAEEHVDCALGGAAAFERVCTVERPAGREAILTLRGPSGSFRRLQVTRDGRGVKAADGAEPATVTIVGKGLIEVAIGTDRYRLPARFR
jgi:hypothetical protein